ncbi:hypothetical protein AAFC00_001897 [Neodothiora populina]|uniref:Zn(2)-C6 fungal-type domain-containing protein n=1 Tax=Neodothiora populina TaxID=2781224 RepID=A0ABR3PQI9_9PEZI
MSSRESCSPPASQECQRKRIARACEGCRLRKTKCDGGKPCRKCKASNIICTTWRSKKPKDKVYAKGYVDVLERRQAQLIAGLEETYHRLVAARLWPGQELPESSGHPLVHDILSVLQVLETNDEDSDSETVDHEVEHRSVADSTSAAHSDSHSMRGTQSPPAQLPALSNSGRTIAPRPSNESVHKSSPLALAPSSKMSSRASLLSPIKISGPDSSLNGDSSVPDSSLPKLEHTISGSSSCIDSEMQPQWANVGATLDNSIVIPGTPDTCSPWEHQYSPDMTDLGMDIDFSLPGESYGNRTLLQMQDQAKTASASHWWMANPTLENQFPESMAAGGLDELSNMLYRDICSDSSMMDMYQQEYGLMPVDGTEPVY